jgi:hypothetical protein
MQSEQTSAKGTTTHILSIDVDDLLIANADFCNAPNLKGSKHQVEHDIDKTLQLLDEYNASATFFVNCQYFDHNQDPLRRILSAGHHLASHGYHHFHIQRISLEDFKADLFKSLEILHHVTDSVQGYRAPAFTMPYRDEYLQILVDGGIKYVSNGAGTNRVHVPLDQQPITLACGLQHVPISTQQLLGGFIRYPIGYAVVARLLPELLYKYSVERWLAGNDYFHFYGHTFEFASSQSPKWYPFKSVSDSVAMLLYSIRCREREKLFRFLLSRCQFQSIEQLLFGVTNGVKHG